MCNANAKIAKKQVTDHKEHRKYFFAINSEDWFLEISFANMRKEGVMMPSEDITFCMNRKCNYKKCERNPKHIRLLIPHSFAYLEDTDYCPKKRKAAK